MMVLFLIVLKPHKMSRVPHQRYIYIIDTLDSDFYFFRLKFADSFFSQLENKSQYFDSGNVDVGISIITVSRNRHAFDKYEPRYLTQVVSYLLHQIQKNKNLNLRYQLYICNVDERRR
jgi:hypothetical protein